MNKEMKTLTFGDVTYEVVDEKAREGVNKHEAELLKAFVKVTTDKAPFHHITDSANMKVLDFGMEGKTEQDTTKGYQLFDINGDINKAYNGTDSSVISNTVENNILTTTGENSSRKAYGQCFTNLNGKTITISAKCVSLGTNTNSAVMSLYEDGVFTKNLEIKGVNTTALLVYTVTSDNFVILFTNVDGTGAQFTDIKVYEGSYTTSTIPEWEPFTNGAFPNPDYEQPITLAGVYNEETGRYEHKCCVGNKNFFNNEWVLGFINTNTGEEQNLTTCLRSDYINLPQQECIIGGLSNYMHYVFAYDDNKQFSRYLGMNATKVILSGNERYIRIGLYNSTVVPESVQIEYGTTETDHVKHASQPFTLTSPVPLTKWDNLVKVDGKWYWDYKQLKLVVNGSNSEFYDDTWRGFRIKNLLPEVMSRRDGYCTQLRVDYGNANPEDVQNHMWLGVSNQHLYIIGSSFYDSELDDKGLANFKAHLNEHPLEIVTYKDESELVPLLDEEQELLRNLEMYYGVTNVYNEQGCPMWLTYISDPKLYVDQKLEQINNTLLSLGANV